MAKAVKKAKAKARPLRSRPRHTFILKRHECGAFGLATAAGVELVTTRSASWSVALATAQRILRDRANVYQEHLLLKVRTPRDESGGEFLFDPQPWSWK